MECNKDDAVKAREIAEKKFLAKDFTGALKFACKAENLYPSLDGISQMVASLHVYVNSETLVNSEKDWYAVLRVTASADEETVKKQYRKLALMLHPDKNKSISADGAFKLISEAWSVLSDKTRRMAYDQKRNLKVRHFSQPNGSSNGFCNFGRKAASSMSVQQNTAQRNPAPAAPQTTRPPNPGTFWTSCKHCKMQYEYLRCYLNHKLFCPNCHEPFMAAETGKSTNGTYSSAPCPPKHQQQTVNQNRASCGLGRTASTVSGKAHGGSNNWKKHDTFNTKFQCGAFSRTAGVASATASSTAAAQAANVVHQTYEKVRKEREEKQAAAKQYENVQKIFQVPKNSSSGVHTVHQNTMTSGSKIDRNHPLNSEEDNTTKKRRCISDYINGSIRPEGKNNVTNRNESFSGTVVFEMEKANSAPGNIDNTRVMHGQTKGFYRELSHVSIHSMLIRKAKLFVHRNLEQLASSETSKMFGKQKTSLKQKQHCDQENLTAIRQEDAPDTIDKKDNPMDFMLEVPDIGDSPGISVDDSNGNDQLPDDSIDVPDPDFHDFDSDRMEKSFESDQVWAIYDDEDGMPRYYVLIQRIISLEPFKIRVRYLNSKSNSEFGSLNWVGKGFSMTCGEFKVGGCRTIDSINMFSHRAALDNVARGVLRIVPRKGETWALYSSWSPDWDENIPDEVVYKYDMVEVLSDYNEEQGVEVSPLRKVAGFKTVFTRQLNHSVEKRIPKEKMFRFSHQVPSYMLTGEEAPNAPKGCLELDPAATSVELLQVISEAVEE